MVPGYPTGLVFYPSTPTLTHPIHPIHPTHPNQLLAVVFDCRKISQGLRIAPPEAPKTGTVANSLRAPHACHNNWSLQVTCLERECTSETWLPRVQSTVSPRPLAILYVPGTAKEGGREF